VSRWEELSRRIVALEARGLSKSIADELWRIGNESLVAEVERASDAELATVNAEWRP
jgi:orotate phosphoribosyltransferase-like protein